MSNLPELWVLRTYFSGPALSVPAGTVVRLLDGEADGNPEYARLAVLDGTAELTMHWDELDPEEDQRSAALRE